MRFRVQISRRDGIADPEGATTAHALQELGYTEVTGVHFGRDIVVEVESDGNDAIFGLSRRAPHLSGRAD